MSYRKLTGYIGIKEEMVAILKAAVMFGHLRLTSMFDILPTEEDFWCASTSGLCQYFPKEFVSFILIQPSRVAWDAKTYCHGIDNDESAKR